MATKKYLSLERLTDYDALIKAEISSSDAATLKSAKDYADGLVSGGHNHDDRYYTETEIDTKLSEVNTSITNITNGNIVVKEAEHADNADEATHATSADSATTATTADSATTAESATKATQDGNGNVIVDVYETKEDAQLKYDELNAGKQNKTIIVTQDSNSKLASHSPAEIIDYFHNGDKVVFFDGGTEHPFLEGDNQSSIFYSSYVDRSRIMATVVQIHADKTMELDRYNYTAPVTSVNGKTGQITLTASDIKADAAGSASSALAEAKSYTDAATANVKNELLNGAGEAYDTLKELGDLINENVDAIDALETVASGKADKEHTHTIESIDGLQDAVNAAADSKFYVVTFEATGGVYHADLTFAEIRERFEAGGNMVARIDGTDYIPLLSAATHQIIFSGIYQAQSVALTISSNEVCTLTTTPLARQSHSHSNASTTSSGFMSSDDKVKLNSIDPSSYETKEDAQSKYDTLVEATKEYVDGKADIEHTHTISEVTNLQETLDKKANSGHNHSAAAITNGTISAARLPVTSVAKGGTGATTVEAARTNLDVYSKEEIDTSLSHTVESLHEYVDEKVAEGGGSGVSSWNDLTDKPFYSEVSVTEIVNESEVVWEDVEYLDNGRTSLSWQKPTYVSPDKKYLLTINGEETLLDCFDLSAQFEGANVCMLTDMGSVAEDMTGYVSILVFNAPEMGAVGGQGNVPRAYDEDNFHMSISKYVEDIRYLDPKYIKDMYYTEKGGLVEILPETDAIHSDDDIFAVIADLDLVVGEKYNVNYNGTEYECVAQDGSFMQAGMVVLGNAIDFGLNGNNELFCAMTGEEEGVRVLMIMTLDGATSVTISIHKYGEGIVHQIPSKYIPDEFATKDYVDGKNKLPITTSRFWYANLSSFDGNTDELKAQNIAKYDTFIYQGCLSNELEMSSNAYARDLAIYKRVLEINPDFKMFGYITARGFGYVPNTSTTKGMTEYRTSPEGIDHPIWTKEELFNYMNLMAHCGGTIDEDTLDEYGNPTRTCGVPLYGVFYDDFGYNYRTQNEHLLNQGDWTSIRDKQNSLIDYAHSLGLSNMANSSADDVFSYEATDDYYNPDGLISHMDERDWFTVESYFIRSDYVFSGQDTSPSIYNEKYRDIYKSKCAVLSYIYGVDDDGTGEDKQTAATFAIYQALCQGVSSIALHGFDQFYEIPEEFCKYYDHNNSAIYSRDSDWSYTLNVNGYTIKTVRSSGNTSYGKIPNKDSLSTCKVVLNGVNAFNNIFIRSEEIVGKMNTLEQDISAEIDAIKSDSKGMANIYHRAFIDDWIPDITIDDYTNIAPTWSGNYGGENTSTTATWNGQDIKVTCPSRYSWRRIAFDVSELAGKTCEIGFKTIDVYSQSNPSVKGSVSWLLQDTSSNTYFTLPSNTKSESVDGETRCCGRYTFPEDVGTMWFWFNGITATTSGTFIVDVNGFYIVDVTELEEDIAKTWYTNYLQPVSTWGALTSYSNYTIDVDDDGKGITINYTTAGVTPEIGLNLAANDSIFLPGETWEIGVEEFYGYDDDGNDVTNKMQMYFNDGSASGLGFNYYDKTRANYEAMKSELKDGLICLDKATIPDSYVNGFPSTTIMTKPTQSLGGVTRGDGTVNCYHIRIRGVYLYKHDERDELHIRGEDESKTYIKICRVTEKNLSVDIANNDLQSNALYITDAGNLFITDYSGNRIDIINKG